MKFLFIAFLSLVGSAAFADIAVSDVMDANADFEGHMSTDSSLACNVGFDDWYSTNGIAFYMQGVVMRGPSDFDNIQYNIPTGLPGWSVDSTNNILIYSHGGYHGVFWFNSSNLQITRFAWADDGRAPAVCLSGAVPAK
jgi:hypothetical protein